MPHRKHRVSRKRRQRLYRAEAAHTPPGSLIVDPQAPPSQVQVMAYSPEHYVEDKQPSMAAISEYLEKWPVTWVTVYGLGNESVLRALADRFHLHRLALEDVVNLHQRPKVEPFDDQLFLVARLIAQRSPLETDQISLFLGPGFVLTFLKRPDASLEPLRERVRRKQGRLRDAGADYLLYAIIDSITDDYFPALEEYGEQLETLEEEVLSTPSPASLAGIRTIKRDLMLLRRALWPQREALHVLSRDAFALVKDETRLYFRDSYDHTIRLMEMTEHFREHASDLMDVYLSSLSQRMNEVMKTLTVIASVFIPLTFVAGIYGMNFDIESSPFNMPELYTYWGYPAVILFMFALALGMLWYFRRKRWM